jgi:hypothetical protein
LWQIGARNKRQSEIQIQIHDVWTRLDVQFMSFPKTTKFLFCCFVVTAFGRDKKPTHKKEKSFFVLTKPKPTTTMSTSTTTTTLKLQLNDEIRRISLNAPLSLRAIQLRAADLFGVADVATIRFTYVDSDGDAITVGSDGDLSEAIAHFHGKPIKFNVVVSAVSATQPKPTVVEPKVEAKSPEAKPTTPAAPKNLSEFVDSIVNDSELQTLARNFGVSLEGSLSDIVAQAASNPLIAQLIQDFRRAAIDSNDDDDDEDDSESSGEEAVEKNVPVVNGDSEAKPIHNAFCDGCRVRIQGVRYKCAVCADFDFCEKCQVFAARSIRRRIRFTRSSDRRHSLAIAKVRTGLAEERRRATGTVRPARVVRAALVLIMVRIRFTAVASVGSSFSDSSNSKLRRLLRLRLLPLPLLPPLLLLHRSLFNTNLNT